jgi:hypothetical protein
MADTGAAQRPAPADRLESDDAETEMEVAAERRLIHDVVFGAIVGVPVGIAVGLVIVVLAVRFAGVPAGGPELMSVFVGVLIGVFFGALSGFVRNSRALDELDEHLSYDMTPKPVA